MAADGRAFVVASDEALIELISGARNRLVVIAPALTQAVADALSRRLPPAIIDTLFESGEAAPESGAFFGR
jgi:hypothetical protein